jgi:hypothetical protein
VRSASFKPAKGRLKDLKKIDNLIEDLSNTIIESQSLQDKRPRIRNLSKINRVPDIKGDAT